MRESFALDEGAREWGGREYGKGGERGTRASHAVGKHARAARGAASQDERDHRWEATAG